MIKINISGEAGSGKTQALAIVLRALRDAQYEINYLYPNDGMRRRVNEIIDRLDAGGVIPQDRRAIEVTERDTDVVSPFEMAVAAELKAIEPLPEITFETVGEIDRLTIEPNADPIKMAIAFGRQVSIHIGAEGDV